MTLIENAAHELYIALQDAGMVQGSGTGHAEVWKADIKELIAEHMSMSMCSAINSSMLTLIETANELFAKSLKASLNAMIDSVLAER